MLVGYLRKLACVFVSALYLAFIANDLPLKAASALAAWKLENDGILRLRTSSGAKLRAFFQDAEPGKGDRVWIDFPGELRRPRTLLGSGPVKAIRLGKPENGFTRLVVEFNSSISIDPSKLKLVGTSPDQWELDFGELPTIGFSSVGEGSLVRTHSKRTSSKYQLLDSSKLPKVSRGRFSVVIDPGHGGPDVGAVGLRGLRETDVVLDISLQVAKLLEQRGVKVHLTRSSEIDLDLPPRTAMANRLNVDAFISIHANATRNTRRDVNGIETFYYSGYKGFRLASLIQSEVLNVSSGSPDRGVRRSRFFVIRRTNMPAALVETGFLTGRRDSAQLAKTSHRSQLALAISKGVLLYLKEVES